MSVLALLLLQAVTGTDSTVNPCDESLVQHQMNVCAYQAYQAADKKRNAQWEETHNYMKDLDKNQNEDGRIGYAEALRKAQRNWIAFRDSHCQSVAFQFRGGSAEPLLRYNCLEKETKRRTKALADLATEG